MERTAFVSLIHVSAFLTSFLQIVQVIADAFFVYGVLCEAKKSTHFSRAYLCGVTAAISLLLRLVSLAAASFFVLAAANPNHPSLSRLAFLNMELYILLKLVSVIGARHRALRIPQLNRRKAKPLETSLNGATAQNHPPMVLVIVPCHRESVVVVLDSINSVAQSTYSSARIHIFLSLDGTENAEIYTRVVEVTRARNLIPSPPFPCAEAILGGSKLTVSLFEHGGKPACQGRTMKYIKMYHPQYFREAQETCVLLLDSDTVLQRATLQLLTARLFPPSTEPDKLVALSCLQGVSRAHSSFLGAVQDAEYFQHGVLCEVSMAKLGNVTCLSGTMILVRLNALLAVFDSYFNDTSGKTTSLYEHWRRHFGDDRHLTQLLSLKFGPSSTDIHTGTVAETEAKLSLKDLVLQRRRWFLGTVATDAAALCNLSFWCSVPLLSAYRLCVRALAVTDLQMVLLCLVGRCLQMKELSWMVTIQVGIFGLANLLVLSVFDTVRGSLGVLMYPFVALLFPFINAVSIIWALMSLWERQW